MNNLKVPTMAEMIAEGKVPKILFWVGCAGSFDDRAKKITKAIVKILNHCDVSFAVLGTEESCTGDPAKRAGNEFTFQMQAMMNIQVLDGYEVKRIVTGCPHCFNTLKNEYPELGGNYEVLHHTQLIQDLINTGKLALQNGETYKGKKITFHDPRSLIEKLDAELVEMKRCKTNGLCCGAGGAQMFKEAEKGNKEINIQRTEDALESKADIIATGCPFCNTMMTDGIKSFEKEDDIKVIDVAELIANAIDIEG
jgi:heterodisulfide reductase subunit D